MFWYIKYMFCLLDPLLVNPQLIAEKRQCKGPEHYVSKLKTIYLCHEACKGSSTMFLYGLAPRRCNETGCDCYCETASKDGECTTEDHQAFNLYAVGEFIKVDKQGEIVINKYFVVTFKT